MALKKAANPIAAAAVALMSKKREEAPPQAEEEVFENDPNVVSDGGGEGYEDTIGMDDLNDDLDDDLLEAADDPFANDPAFAPAEEEVPNDEQLKEQARLREQMYAQSKADEEEFDWMSGEECEALYFDDEQWYKAMVINAEPDGTYVVEFTEYGNIQEGTQPHEMRKLGAASGQEAHAASDDDDEKLGQATGSGSSPE